MKRYYLLAALLLGLALPAQAQSSTSPPASDEVAEMPDTYRLTPAYPNPFNPRTQFSLAVDRRQEVTVSVYNMLGQPVETLYQGVMEAGETKQFTFEATDLPSGIYIYRVAAEDFTAARQMTLLK